MSKENSQLTLEFLITKSKTEGLDSHETEILISTMEFLVEEGKKELKQQEVTEINKKQKRLNSLCSYLNKTKKTKKDYQRYEETNKNMSLRLNMN